jgi:hypothetical protein
MSKQLIMSMGCALMILCSPSLAFAESTDGVKDAQTWLALVDKGQFEQSWETASAYFKSMVPKEQWVSQIAAVRNPLGLLVSRDLKMNLFQKTLPGAPDGEYYVMSFNTVFKNKASAVETVTVMKDKDGQWRLAGYFIK